MSRASTRFAAAPTPATRSPLGRARSADCPTTAASPPRADAAGSSTRRRSQPHGSTQRSSAAMSRSAGRRGPDARRRLPIRLAAVCSPPMARLATLTNKPSDNFFAEMLVKALAAQAGGRGTTAGGTRLAARFASRHRRPALAARRRLGALAGQPCVPLPGRAPPAGHARTRRVPRVLRLPVRLPVATAPCVRACAAARPAGAAGARPERSPASRAVSGYCRARSGDTYVFSILMNGVNAFGARALQDRMLQAIAGVR